MAIIRSLSSRQVRCGDVVFDCEDPRHLGRVEAIISGLIRVRWRDTGHLSDLPRSDLRFVDELEAAIYAWSLR